MMCTTMTPTFNKKLVLKTRTADVPNSKYNMNKHSKPWY